MYRSCSFIGLRRKPLPAATCQRLLTGFRTAESPMPTRRATRFSKASRRRFAAVACAAFAGVAVSAHMEAEPDELALPRQYDADSITAYWQKRSWTVRRRYLEILWELLPLILRFLVEWKCGRLADNDDACRQHASRTREALTRLGPAFIKVGQALSIRPDLMPGIALKELQRLCDDCPAFEWDVARAAIEEGLGCDVHEVFDCLETSPKPMAAASLGQVYKWKLKADGSTVAVKVQRPLMAHSVSLDIYILRRLAHHIRTLTQLITLSRMDHVALVDAWAKGTVRELDYEAEALNQERFKQELGRIFPTNRIYVPSVHHELASRCVLVSEWIHGPRLADCSPAVVRSLCSIGVECFLAQLLDIGLFHSDPHPGNLLVSDGRLVLLDFGLVAEVEDLKLQRLATAIVNLINADYEELLNDFIELGFLPSDVNREQVLPPMQRVIEQGMKAGGDMSRRKKHFADIADDLSDIFFEFPFSVPDYFALVTRALATLEGIALVGNPDFDIFWAAYPYALSRAMTILGPRRASGLLSAATARTAMNMTASERVEMVGISTS